VVFGPVVLSTLTLSWLLWTQPRRIQWAKKKKKKKKGRYNDTLQYRSQLLKGCTSKLSRGRPWDQQVFARKTTLLLFLSRLLVFKYCINVPGSNETFTSARWALVQVCPHVLFKDMFNELFLKLVHLQHHGELTLSLLIRNVYEDAKDCLIVRGCLPKIQDGTRLLVIDDEAQFLGDQFNGSFQSMSSSEDSLRPLLSPILYAFRDIGQHQFTLVTCGTCLSIPCSGTPYVFSCKYIYAIVLLCLHPCKYIYSFLSSKRWATKSELTTDGHLCFAIYASCLPRSPRLPFTQCYPFSDYV
jgi:hypothetical protein